MSKEILIGVLIVTIVGLAVCFILYVWRHRYGNRSREMQALLDGNQELELKVEQRTLVLKEALQELEISQKELKEALSKEKELHEIKSRFISMASHEFRTPLSTLLSSAALLSKYTLTEDQDKRDKHILRIKDTVRHLNELLDDFLSLGKLDEALIQVERTKFSVREFLDEIIEESRSMSKTGQVIYCDYGEDHEFFGDRRLLRQILLNLLSNAVKFSPEGSGIWLQLRRSPGKAMIFSIKDEGMGISPGDQVHLFNSFFRGANAQNIEGTGLGLHLVRRYVNLLGGDLLVDSVLNQGTIVLVNVPEATGHPS